MTYRPCGDGGFAIISETNPFGKTIAPKPARVRASAKTTNDIIHPIFVEFCKLTNDPYWVEVFTNASKNLFPRGFSYHDGFLQYKIRSKIDTLPLQSLDITSVYDFMMKRGVISQTDISTRKQIENDTVDDISKINNWTSIKSDKLKNNLISTYVAGIASHYNLNEEQIAILESKIKTALGAGYINTNNIVIKDGTIVEILCLNRDKENGTFIIEYNSCVSPSKSYNRKTPLSSLYSSLSSSNEEGEECSSYNTVGSRMKRWCTTMNKLKNF